MVSQNLKVVKRAVEKVKLIKLTLVQTIQDHVHVLIDCRKSSKTSALAMDTVSGQLEAIKGQEQLLHTQIRDVLGNIFVEFNNTKDISDVL